MAIDTAPSYIRLTIPRSELLSLLAEEASELSQAALKLRRAEDGINPTPVPAATAAEHLIEEISDVVLVLQILKLEPDQDTIHRKLQRWVSRLRENREMSRKHE